MRAETMSIAICDHVDSSKSTTTGRLIFEPGGFPEHELEKLKAEAERLSKGSFAFASYMDRQKEERERGVTLACTTKELYTGKWHNTISDAPGHRDFINNMFTGASQADVALVMVPADGNFTAAIAKGNHKAGEIQGQTRQHSHLINLLGVKQISIGIKKMDGDTAAYKQSRYDEIANELKSMLVKVGRKKDVVEKNTPILAISGWMGDNLERAGPHGRGRPTEGVAHKDWMEGGRGAISESDVLPMSPVPADVWKIRAWRKEGGPKQTLLALRAGPRHPLADTIANHVPRKGRSF